MANSLVLSCLVLSCLVLSCLVLSCLVLSCLVLSCLVFVPQTLRSVLHQHFQDPSRMLEIMGLLRALFPLLMEPFPDHPASAAEIDTHSLNWARVTQYLESLAGVVTHHKHLSSSSSSSSSSFSSSGGLQESPQISPPPSSSARDGICASQLQLFVLDLVGIAHRDFLVAEEGGGEPCSVLEAGGEGGRRRQEKDLNVVVLRKVVRVPCVVVDVIEDMAIDSQLQIYDPSVVKAAVKVLRVLRPSSCEGLQRSVEIGVLLDDFKMAWEDLDHVLHFENTDTLPETQPSTASAALDTVAPRASRMFSRAEHILEIGAEVAAFLPLLPSHDAKLQAYKILTSLLIRVMCERQLQDIDTTRKCSPTAHVFDDSGLKALLLRLQFSCVDSVRVLFYDFVGFLLLLSHDIWDSDRDDDDDNDDDDDESSGMSATTTAILLESCFKFWVRAPDSWSSHAAHGSGRGSATFAFSVYAQEGSGANSFSRLPSHVRRDVMMWLVWENTEMLHKAVTCAMRDPCLPVGETACAFLDQVSLTCSMLHERSDVIPAAFPRHQVASLYHHVKLLEISNQPNLHRSDDRARRGGTTFRFDGFLRFVENMVDASPQVDESASVTDFEIGSKLEWTLRLLFHHDPATRRRAAKLLHGTLLPSCGHIKQQSSETLCWMDDPMAFSGSGMDDLKLKSPLLSPCVIPSNVEEPQSYSSGWANRRSLDATRLCAMYLDTSTALPLRESALQHWNTILASVHAEACRKGMASLPTSFRLPNLEEVLAAVWQDVGGVVVVSTPKPTTAGVGGEGHDGGVDDDDDDDVFLRTSPALRGASMTCLALLVRFFPSRVLAHFRRTETRWFPTVLRCIFDENQETRLALGHIMVHALFSRQAWRQRRAAAAAVALPPRGKTTTPPPDTANTVQVLDCVLHEFPVHTIGFDVQVCRLKHCDGNTFVDTRWDVLRAILQNNQARTLCRPQLLDKPSPFLSMANMLEWLKSSLSLAQSHARFLAMATLLRDVLRVDPSVKTKLGRQWNEWESIFSTFVKTPPTGRSDEDVFTVVLSILSLLVTELPCGAVLTITNQVASHLVDRIVPSGSGVLVARRHNTTTTTKKTAAAPSTLVCHMFRFLRHLTALGQEDMSVGFQISFALMTNSSILTTFLARGFFCNKNVLKGNNSSNNNNPSWLCHQRECLLLFGQILGSLTRPMMIHARHRPDHHQSLLRTHDAFDATNDAAAFAALKFDCLRDSPLFRNLSRVTSALILCIASHYCVPDSFCGKAVTKRAMHALYLCSLLAARRQQTQQQQEDEEERGHHHQHAHDDDDDDDDLTTTRKFDCWLLSGSLQWCLQLLEDREASVRGVCLATLASLHTCSSAYTAHILRTKSDYLECLSHMATQPLETNTVRGL
jgi:hypothetical protein